MFDPRLKDFAPPLVKAIEELESINFEDHETALAEMSDEERTTVARKLGRNIDKARRALTDLDDVKRLVGTPAVPTLRGWAKQAGCPIRIFFDRSGDNFYVGSSEIEKLRIEVPEEMEQTLGTLPHLGGTNL